MPGSLTSRIRQLGPSLRGVDKNSCAVAKDLECKPTDSSSSWRDSRTSLSSSTINTVGTSCVLICARPGQKWADTKQRRLQFLVAAIGHLWIIPRGMTNSVTVVSLLRNSGVRNRPDTIGTLNPHHRGEFPPVRNM